jgi:4-amino-4-deoxy-L-arabinose transferase-like glycosyltransferase
MAKLLKGRQKAPPGRPHEYQAFTAAHNTVNGRKTPIRALHPVPFAKTKAAAPRAALPQAAQTPYRLWLVIALGALFLVRLIALMFAKTDLFFDEAQYWAWSRELAFGYFSKPPLIAWIIRGATSICGDSEWCLRAPSPILYAATSYLAYLAGRAVFDERIGFWSAIVLATLPGVSFSSGLISTDVPLLACWTLALFAWIRLVQTRRMADAILLVAAVGVGLLAKYAAIYFLFCAAIDAWRDKNARAALGRGRGLIACVLALAIVAPNLAWNATHGFATFSHTAANASWRGAPVHFGAALEFLGAQFGTFGPILFGALLVIVWRCVRGSCDEPERRLLAFSLPVLVLITAQALFSRAFANWAAVAYPAATILVTAVLLATHLSAPVPHLACAASWCGPRHRVRADLCPRFGATRRAAVESAHPRPRLARARRGHAKARRNAWGEGDPH